VVRKIEYQPHILEAEVELSATIESSTVVAMTGIS